MKYDIDYFIKKFSKIPANLWTVGSYSRGAKHCALGHCGKRRLETGYENDSKEATALVILFENALNLNVTNINDKESIYDRITNMSKPVYVGEAEDIFGKSPKERMLTVLENIKGAGLVPS